MPSCVGIYSWLCGNSSLIVKEFIPGFVGIYAWLCRNLFLAIWEFIPASLIVKEFIPVCVGIYSWLWENLSLIVKAFIPGCMGSHVWLCWNNPWYCSAIHPQFCGNSSPDKTMQSWIKLIKFAEIATENKLSHFCDAVTSRVGSTCHFGLLFVFSWAGGLFTSGN